MIGLGMVAVTYLIVGLGAYNAGAFENFNTNNQNTTVIETTVEANEQAGMLIVEPAFYVGYEGDNDV